MAKEKLSKRDRSEALGILSDDDSDSQAEDGIFGDSDDEEAGRKRKRKPAKSKDKPARAAAAAAEAEDDDSSRLEGETLARHEMRIEGMRMDAQARMAKDVHASFLAAFFPVLKNVLQHPGEFGSVMLQRTAAVTMARYAQPRKIHIYTVLILNPYYHVSRLTSLLPILPHTD